MVSGLDQHSVQELLTEVEGKLKLTSCAYTASRKN